jgi:hypothetical protein
MYVIREVLNCHPGKVQPLIERFRSLSQALEARDFPPLRLLTDVAGERFWTRVVEATVQRVEDFFAVEEDLMADPDVRAAMAGYHDLIECGSREIFRIEG